MCVTSAKSFTLWSLSCFFFLQTQHVYYVRIHYRTVQGALSSPSPTLCKHCRTGFLSCYSLHDPDNHDGVTTHLEPDILECEVKWALESITTKQSQWRWWNSSGAISNAERWCCESAALNMPPNLDNSVVATGLEKVSFHSNAKERQCQRMLKLPHNCTHLTR